MVARYVRSNCRRSSAVGEATSLLILLLSTIEFDSILQWFGPFVLHHCITTLSAKPHLVVSKYNYSKVGTIRLVLSCC